MTYLTRRSLSLSHSHQPQIPPSAVPKVRKRYYQDSTSSSSEEEDDEAWSTKTDSLVLRQSWDGQKRSRRQRKVEKQRETRGEAEGLGRMLKTGGRGLAKGRGKGVKVEPNPEPELEDSDLEEEVEEPVTVPEKRKRQQSPSTSWVSGSRSHFNVKANARVRARSLKSESEESDSGTPPPPSQIKRQKRKRLPRPKTTTRDPLASDESGSGSDLSDPPTEDEQHDDNDEDHGIRELQSEITEGGVERVDQDESPYSVDTLKHTLLGDFDPPHPTSDVTVTHIDGGSRRDDTNFASQLSELKAKRATPKRSAGLPIRFRQPSPPVPVSRKSHSKARDYGDEGTGRGRGKKRVRIDEDLNTTRIIPAHSVTRTEPATTSQSPWNVTKSREGLSDAIQAVRYNSIEVTRSTQHQVADSEFPVSSDSDNDDESDSGTVGESSSPSRPAITAVNAELGGLIGIRDDQPTLALITGLKGRGHDDKDIYADKFLGQGGLDLLLVAGQFKDASKVAGPAPRLGTQILAPPQSSIEVDREAHVDAPSVDTTSVSNTEQDNLSDQNQQASRSISVVGIGAGLRYEWGPMPCWHSSQNVMPSSQIKKFIKEWQKPVFNFGKVSRPSSVLSIYLDLLLSFFIFLWSLATTGEGPRQLMGGSGWSKILDT